MLESSSRFRGSDILRSRCFLPPMFLFCVVLDLDLREFHGFYEMTWQRSLSNQGMRTGNGAHHGRRACGVRVLN